MSETVLVTGVGGPAGSAGASYFAKKGYRVVGTDIRAVESPANELRLVPAARDPRFAAVLLAMAVQEQASLVVSTVTEELPLVARMRSALRERGVSLCISDPPGVDVANDKLRTAEDLDRAGVAVPVTFSGDTPHREITGALGFPLLSKPRFGRGGRGVFVHRGKDDLACASPEEVVWQEFLPGEEYDLNLFVERDGGVPAAVVLRKTGLKDGLVGNALGVERVERSDVAELGVRAARSLGLEGPIDMDIRLAEDGTPAVLEVNARLGANVLSASEVLDALDDAWRNGRCA
ncbi:MAG TPA: ATP-grasp domain-containing protein [Myxococcales bacterium]|jgi:carbamoyl-phosphate synthase large subunit|nr:ATP-grasp domain-containing protein [Myxococcales bacterium]